jgi:predicted metal-dependent peptidase
VSKKRELESIVRAAGIKLNVVENLTIDGTNPLHGRAKVDKDGSYVIELNAQLDEKGYETVLMHELSHILHGDLLVKDKDMMLWNIATDQRINAVLDHDEVKRLDGILPESLLEIEEIKNLPRVPIAWPAVMVYEALEKEAEDMARHMANNLDEMVQEGDISETDHVKTILKVRKLAEASGVEEIQSQIESMIQEAIGKGNGTNRPIGKPLPKEVKAIRAVLDKIEAVHATKTRHIRSWRRPGRLPVLRGSYRQLVTKIAACCDVSGSTHSIVDVLSGVTFWLQKEEEYETLPVVWASTAEVINSFEDTSEASVGWGTAVQNLFDLLKKEQVDVAVIATDGYIDDWYPEPPFPVVWVLPGRNDRINIPYGTTIVIEG